MFDDGPADGVYPCPYRARPNQARLGRGLRRQHSAQVRVGHRVERVVLHAAFIQKLVANEQMAIEDRPAIDGQRRAERHPVGAQLLLQRLRHRADIAVRCRVECGAIFEEEPPRRSLAQCRQHLQRLRHRVLLWDGAGFQRHDHRVGGLNRPQTAFHQHRRHIRRTGKVVGYAAEP